MLLVRAGLYQAILKMRKRNGLQMQWPPVGSRCACWYVGFKEHTKGVGDCVQRYSYLHEQGSSWSHGCISFELYGSALSLEAFLSFFLGLFPEDHHISVKQLIRMWIAESTISEVQGDSITMEDAGRHHLDELIHRCMVQIAERDSQGRANRCQLHDKMRDLAITKGGQENFFEIVGRTAAAAAAEIGSRKLRRCAINLEDDKSSRPFLKLYSDAMEDTVTCEDAQGLFLILQQKSFKRWPL